jgi:acetylornithine deacetylase/succinyl-diaminopimelate desuccinylase-like protein
MPTSPTPYPTLSVTPERSRLAVDQLLRLMAADSTSGREEPAIAVMLELARELGLPAERLPAGPGRDNVLIGHGAPEIVLCTHLDTVPPFIPGRLVDGVVWGRGACDAKGVAIAMLHALDLVRAASPDVRASCLFVVGEETDHLGAKAVVASGRFGPRHVLLGEPCGMTPAVGQKGLLKVRLAASGKSGHSAYPEVGISATHRLVRVLATILETRWPSTSASSAAASRPTSSRRAPRRRCSSAARRLSTRSGRRSATCSRPTAEISRFSSYLDRSPSTSITSARAPGRRCRSTPTRASCSSSGRVSR